MRNWVEKNAIFELISLLSQLFPTSIIARRFLAEQANLLMLLLAQDRFIFMFMFILCTMFYWPQVNRGCCKLPMHKWNCENIAIYCAADGNNYVANNVHKHGCSNIIRFSTYHRFISAMAGVLFLWLISNRAMILFVYFMLINAT